MQKTIKKVVENEEVQQCPECGEITTMYWGTWLETATVKARIEEEFGFEQIPEGTKIEVNDWFRTSRDGPKTVIKFSGFVTRAHKNQCERCA